MPIHILPEPNVLMTRREVIGGLVAAASLVGCSRNAGSRGNEAGWYALLSDPHIAADPAATLRGEVMFENLRAVVADILRADDAPRGVIVDGDLAFQQGDLEDYTTFAKAVDPLLQAGLPLHLTLGNHDHRTNLRSSLAALVPHDLIADRVLGTLDHPGIRFALLDSQNGVNVTAGRLGLEQLSWLAGDLDAHPKAVTIVCVHHNINAHSESALSDTDALLDVIRPRRQVKAVVFGHTHVWNAQKIDEIHMINLPAVGYRFQPKQPLGWVELRPHSDGAEVELRCIGGDRSKNGKRIELSWRST